MKSALLFFLTICLAFMLAACEQLDTGEATKQRFPTATLNPTPTLVPGLPTSTPGLIASPATIEPTSIPITPTPLPSPTETPIPTNTPPPESRIEIGQMYLAHGNYDAAVDQFLNSLLSGSLNPIDRQQALYGLSLSQFERGYFTAAADAFSELLASSASSTESTSPGFQGLVDINRDSIPVSDAYYYLGKISMLEGDCEAAIGAYESYYALNQDMASYIVPEIASCYLGLDDPQSALSLYEMAVDSPALEEINIALRMELARQYLSSSNFEGTLEQYDALANLATTEEAKGKANYLMGSTLLALGEFKDGYDYFREAIELYPRAFDSYLALSALIEIGEDVNDLDRGVVDFYAAAYEPAINALSRYLEGNDQHDEDAHLFLAWSYEGLVPAENALTQIDAYIEATAPVDEQETGEEGDSLDTSETLNPARGWLERARLQTRSGNLPGAISDYQELLALYPEDAEAPLAAWWVAAYSEQLGFIEPAIESYELMAQNYPDHEDAPEALFRAGYLAHQAGDDERAAGIWQQAVDEHIDAPYGAASLVWLFRISGIEPDQFIEQAQKIPGSDFYQLRARHIAGNTDPFEVATSVKLEATEEERFQAEEWLRAQLELEPAADIRTLLPELAQDGRLTRGQKLLRLGRWQEAKVELESLRWSFRENMLASYQLALIFRDLGLYRSSILAALSVLRLAETDVLEAPPFIGKLAYPIYYSGMVEEQAALYGFDPLLQFALIRQESLFESFAKSSAVAQGLSQVIPDTGAFIAQRLEWPDYQNEDLYKPYVGIAFGAYYLDQQLDSFNDDVAAALSAYNAGPGNAARWYDQAPHDIDLMREIVNFSETQQYIDRIYEGHAIYSYLYGQEE